jgi:hypothetical protein
MPMCTNIFRQCVNPCVESSWTCPCTNIFGKCVSIRVSCVESIWTCPCVPTSSDNVCQSVCHVYQHLQTMCVNPYVESIRACPCVPTSSDNVCQSVCGAFGHAHVCQHLRKIRVWRGFGHAHVCNIFPALHKTCCRASINSCSLGGSICVSGSILETLDANERVHLHIWHMSGCVCAHVCEFVCECESEHSTDSGRSINQQRNKENFAFSELRVMCVHPKDYHKNTPHQSRWKSAETPSGRQPGCEDETTATLTNERLTSVLHSGPRARSPSLADSSLDWISLRTSLHPKKVKLTKGTKEIYKKARRKERN